MLRSKKYKCTPAVTFCIRNDLEQLRYQSIKRGFYKEKPTQPENKLHIFQGTDFTFFTKNKALMILRGM